MDNINQFVLYTGDDGDVKLQIFLEDETLWLSQKLIGDLFQVESHTVNYHIKEIYKSGELEELATTRKFRVVQKEGSRDVSRDVIFYNLDVIIAVGYRVNSKRATQFRIWATKVLKEYLIKGFVLDDERLKQGEKVFNKDYFKELLEEFVLYVQAREGSTSRLQIYLLNVALTMILIQKSLKSFMQQYKTNSIMLLQGKLLQKSYIQRQIRMNPIWVF